MWDGVPPFSVLSLMTSTIAEEQSGGLLNPATGMAAGPEWNVIADIRAE
jgi:hypothetical protein